METLTTSEKNTAAFTHLSCLTQYFIPFGNYIFPTVIWLSKKGISPFTDYNGKQVLNFQLSLLLYLIVLTVIAGPIFLITIFQNFNFSAHFNSRDFFIEQLSFDTHQPLLTIGIVAVLFIILLKVIEFFLIIYATIKTANGEYYKYPFTISFLK
ncbi:DUF4870 domain-containing protein [Flavobacterium sp. UMI-01]|uniref:DUF4870 domain-containing protein n=1 Tax=Flavobacterium sp. UMI-01 TaxID=1441053 RepID=UPI001C7D3C3F|nr:DUF4870 domain-containing protein [Flavobacterium sp. UMI-01]GIZ10298.1 hypothetical protein FUMI01_30220 [Flavobacterium sp. UMI-01]